MCDGKSMFECFLCPWFSEARQTCILEVYDPTIAIPADCRRWE